MGSNIISTSNLELVQHITQIVVNAHIAYRIEQLPTIDPDLHFEHAEAKVMTGLFDGPMPSEEEFEAIRNMPADQRPPYYHDIYTSVMNILQTFSSFTGKHAINDELNLRERAVLWTEAMACVHRLSSPKNTQRPRKARR